MAKLQSLQSGNRREQLDALASDLPPDAQELAVVSTRRQISENCVPRSGPTSCNTSTLLLGPTKF